MDLPVLHYYCIFYLSFDPSYSNLILNIPIFFIGWKLLGRTTFIYTLIGTFSVSLFLWIFQRYEVLNLHVNLQNDMTLAALFAGAFIGIGLGSYLNTAELLAV